MSQNPRQGEHPGQDPGSGAEAAGPPSAHVDDSQTEDIVAVIAPDDAPEPDAGSGAEAAGDGEGSGEAASGGHGGADDGESDDSGADDGGADAGEAGDPPAQEPETSGAGAGASTGASTGAGAQSAGTAGSAGSADAVTGSDAPDDYFGSVPSAGSPETGGSADSAGSAASASSVRSAGSADQAAASPASAASVGSAGASAQSAGTAGTAASADAATGSAGTAASAGSAASASSVRSDGSADAVTGSDAPGDYIDYLGSVPSAGSPEAGGSAASTASAASAERAASARSAASPAGATSATSAASASAGSAASASASSAASPTSVDTARATPEPPATGDQEVAQPPSSPASAHEEAATPAEAGPEGADATPLPDQGAHMISWIQHGGGKLPPSIAPALPPSRGSGQASAAEAASGAGTEDSREAAAAGNDPGGQLNAPSAPLAGHVWSEPGQDAGKAVLGESRWPSLRSAATGSAQADAEGATAPSRTASPADPALAPARGSDTRRPGQAGNETGAAASSTTRDSGAGATTKTTAPPRRRRRLLPLCAAAGLALAALWGGLAWWTTQHIASGTTVSGVDLSGLSPEQASTRLNEQVGAQLSQPVTLTVGQGSSELTPAESGISLDAEASVDKVTGFTLNPITIAQRLTGTETDAVVRIDTKTLTGALEDRIGSMANGAVSATVTLEGTNVVTTPAQDGVGLDVKASVDKLNRDGWPLGEQSIALVEGTAVPAITDAEAKDFVDGTLNPMLSANMTVTTAGTEVESKTTSPTLTLTPQTTASMTTISTDGGQLTATLDATMLHETLLATLGDVEKPAIDASWTIDGTQEGAAGDTPQYVAPAQGMGIDLAALSQSLTTTAAQGTDPASRTVALPLTVLEPQDTTPEADWGVKEIVGEYSTPYNGADLPRTQNLQRGAELINGTVVKPGEVFSLEETLGEVDYEHGFADAGVISNGEHIDSLGGGLSQVATTVFNAGFEAGMDDTEHHPHQYFFDRYPAGREATLWTGKLDVKFTNSTPHGVLVQAWLDGEEIHVRLWSTKYYDVTISQSDRYNFRPVVTERKSGPQCVPYSGGNAGFDITVTRKRSHGGQALPDDVLTTAYYPDNNIICD